MDTLKLITCGSVDDGKSTLIGHMLYDAKLLYTDQLRALELDSKIGSADGGIDYSLLLDGLMAEREQGITIDAAYRYFTTDRRSFIIADCPGHEQYTKNMAVGASFADLAVILVDASKGVVIQTKRHWRICAIMGIKHFVLAVNKMDLVGYDKKFFERISRDFKSVCSQFDVETLKIIPLSAVQGDNVTKPSLNMPWYKGKTFLHYLETIDVSGSEQNSEGFIMPVQRVCRPNKDFRGFQGEIDSGEISVGSEVIVLPNKETANVKQILLLDKDVQKAWNGQPVTLRLDKEIDVSRGSVISAGQELALSSMLNATVIWLDSKELTAGREYIMKCSTKTIPATVMVIKHQININTGGIVPVGSIRRNDIINCDISLAEKIVFDSFENSKTLGGFILIDRVSNATSACGVINHSLRRSGNLFWHNTVVTPEMRADQKNQKPLTLWFTGLSGSGKSTLANEIEKRLVTEGKHTMLLDGDNIRQGLNKNLGFKDMDRIENIRRISEVTKLMNDAGLIVLTAFISPFREDREKAREIIGGSFIEIYLSADLEACESRDVKGLYKSARAGEIPMFTGITSPYETPKNCEITIDTGKLSVDESASLVLEWLKRLL